MSTGLFHEMEIIFAGVWILFAKISQLNQYIWYLYKPGSWSGNILFVLKQGLHTKVSSDSNNNTGKSVFTIIIFKVTFRHIPVHVCTFVLVFGIVRFCSVLALSSPLVWRHTVFSMAAFWLDVMVVVCRGQGEDALRLRQSHNTRPIWNVGRNWGVWSFLWWQGVHWKQIISISIVVWSFITVTYRYIRLYTKSIKHSSICTSL